MVQGMHAIKRRIKSVEATNKITTAMQLVATSKLQKTKRDLDGLKPYYQKLQTTVAEILLNNKGVTDNLYLQNNPEGVEGYIIIGSSLGLCGAYNANIIKKMNTELSGSEHIFPIGTKLRSRLQNHQGEINQQFESLNTSMDFAQVSMLVAKLTAMYQNKELAKIKIIYTEFINNVTCVPRCITLLPVDTNEFTNIAITNKITIFEPNADTVLNTLIPMYLQGVIHGCLIESVTSENSLRRKSMQAAIDNAEELREQLVLQFNQARQTAITNEISEIVAGTNTQ